MKFFARSTGGTLSPVAFCTDTWNSMNEAPIKDVAAYSAPIPGQMQGSAAPSATPTDTTSIGPRTPTRSDSRPAATLSQIGRNAYKPISVPTTSGDAPIDRAYSETVTRLTDTTE